MQPAKPPNSNVVLTLTDPNTGARDPDGDLHAERCIDPDGRHLIETHWQPDEGERRALANGAPVILHVWGHGHPPVRLTTGEPDPDGSGVLLGEHVNRALGLLFAHLADYSGAYDKQQAVMITGRTITPDAMIDLWADCLRETAVHDGRGAGMPDTADQLLDQVDRHPPRTEPCPHPNPRDGLCPDCGQALDQ